MHILDKEFNLLFTNYCTGVKSRKIKWQAFGTLVTEEKCTKCDGGEAWKKKTTWKTSVNERIILNA
jgi:hypothetical protein